MITAKLKKRPTLKAVVTKPYQGKGYADGYADGLEKGYANGEADANAAAEAANAVILTDCNAVLPSKGVETADTLEQVPQRIGEIQSFADGYDVGVVDGKQVVNQWWLDFTRNKKYFHYFFTTGANEYFLIETPAIDTSNGTHFTSMFENCRALEVIGGVLDLSNGAYFNSMFASCYALREIRFVPLSIKKSNAMNHSSNLSAESIQSIIDGLADLTGKTAQTFTFHKDVGNKLTDAQKATITAKNWTLVY